MKELGADIGIMAFVLQFAPQEFVNIPKHGTIQYLMSGIDNLRPWDNGAIRGFLDRRAKHSDVAAIAAVVSRLKYLGAADDSAAYKGARIRRKTAEYRARAEDLRALLANNDGQSFGGRVQTRSEERALSMVRRPAGHA